MTAERHLSFARNLRIETRSVAGEDAATRLVDFARQHRVTQIFTARPVWPGRSGGNGDLVNRIVRLAGDMQVTIVARREPKPS